MESARTSAGSAASASLPGDGRAPAARRPIGAITEALGLTADQADAQAAETAVITAGIYWWNQISTNGILTADQLAKLMAGPGPRLARGGRR